MREFPSAWRDNPLRIIADVSAYAALATLIIVLSTASGVVAGIVGALTVGLLVGSYLLERWARQRTMYSPDTQSSPTPAAADVNHRTRSVTVKTFDTSQHRLNDAISRRAATK